MNEVAINHVVFVVAIKKAMKTKRNESRILFIIRERMGNDK